MTESQLERYRRQMMLPEIGIEGQEKISKSKILVIGAGGLGSPVLYYLAAAGVGTIGITDSDSVDLSNLNRQILHTTPGIGRLKAESAAEKLSLLNPEIKTEVYPLRLTEENGEAIISCYDFIIDASDNSHTRYLINDLCVKAGKPFSHGAINGMKGYTFTHVPGSPCYRCLFGIDTDLHDIPENSPAGVLGAITGIIGSIQAAEAIKYLTGSGTLLTGRLLIIDAFTMETSVLKFSQINNCMCHV